MAVDVTISERIRGAIADFLKQDVDTIEAHQSLRNDLGLNQVDTVELVFELEEAFNFEIPDQDFPKLTTVSEVIAYVEGRVRKVSPKRAVNVKTDNLFLRTHSPHHAHRPHRTDQRRLA